MRLRLARLRSAGSTGERSAADLDLPAATSPSGPDLDVPEDVLTSDGVGRRTWSLERANGEVVAKHLRLLDGGRMSGFRFENEYRWEMVDGHVTFFNEDSERTTVFDEAQSTLFDRWTLRGRYRLPPFEDVTHVLREIDPLGIAPPTDGAGIGLRGAAGAAGAGQRRNLVVLRANEASLHREWARNIAETERSWDLCVSWYGQRENMPAPGEQEFIALQPEFRKFSGIHQLFFDGSPLWNYDFIMLPDDDLLLSWRDLNRSFDMCREHGLELAQPALREGSHWGIDFVLQQPNTRLRFTSFVESMMPIFSREALSICLPTFPQSLIGWGLDVIWPSLLGSRRTNTAILDCVSVLHTRPVGASYNGTEADRPGTNVIKLYGVQPRVMEYGRLLA